MTNTNPQIEDQLDKLADLCCNSLEGGADGLGDDCKELLQSLLMSGYARKEDRNLRSDLESRIKDRCREPAMHRGGALSSMTEDLQNQFTDLVRWESRQPESRDKPKSANISSATKA